MKCIKTIFITFFIAVSSLPAWAQWDQSIIQNPGTGKYSVGLYGNADYSSTAITSAFAENFLEGNYITDNLKQQVVSNLQTANRAGFSLNTALTGVLYNDSIGKHTFNFFVALKDRNYVNASFPPDVFKIAFYGNASYAGETAQLSPFNFNDVSYQQLEVGSICTNLWGKAKLGAGISFLAGQQLQAVNMSAGYLYTDPYGQYLQLTSNTKYNASDSTPGHNFFNGYGASVDIYFSMPYKIVSKPGVLSVSVNDLGFIKWNSHALSYNKDTTYTYNGVTINSLNDLQNAAINNLSKDSLQNKYFPRTAKSFYTSIPTTVSIDTKTNLGKIDLEIGAWYIFNANCLPYYYIQGNKAFSHHWYVNLQLGYGGYATYNASVGITKQIKNTGIRLAVNHLQGIILPGDLGGAGAFLAIEHSFK